MHPAEDAFGRWFSDSKVVDASGAPLVVYHGTASDFSRFDSGRGAMYFTSDPAIASLYAFEAEAYDKQGRHIEPSPHVIPVYLSMQNPLVVDEAWAVENLDDDGDRDWTAFDNTAYQAEEDGHDGVILRGVVDFAGVNEAGERTVRAYDQFVVFRATQIKSVHNCGAFDPANPDITDRMIRAARAKDLLANLSSGSPQP